MKVSRTISLKFAARSLLSSRGIRARIGLVGLQRVKILQLLDLRFLLLLLAAVAVVVVVVVAVVVAVLLAVVVLCFHRCR